MERLDFDLCRGGAMDERLRRLEPWRTEWGFHVIQVSTEYFPDR